MKTCPYCAESIPMAATQCPQCRADLTTAGPPLMLVPTSGKAVASLVLGILGSFVFTAILALVFGYQAQGRLSGGELARAGIILLGVLGGAGITALLALVFGYQAREEIRQARGKLSGAKLARAGIILGWVYTPLIGIAWILMIAAIAIPNLLQSRIAANQASAVGSCRTINTAEITYASTYNIGYSATLLNIGPDSGGGNPSSTSASLIDSVLAAGAKSGYTFTYTPGPVINGRVTTYTLNANPITPGTTGTNFYFTDETGVIRLSSEGPASAESPPVGG